IAPHFCSGATGRSVALCVLSTGHSLSREEIIMSGRFRASGSVEMVNVGLFAIHGEIVDGVAHVGQYARAPSGFQARVHGVEVVRTPAGQEDLALTFLAADAAEYARWCTLSVAGEELNLAEIRPS